MIKNNIGIDLGSDNIRIYLQKENKIINSKPIVAIDVFMNEIVAYGKEANLINEKEPENLILKKPIKKGKIEDVELMTELLKLILRDNTIKKRIINPNILVSYEKSLNSVEKEALIDVLRQLGVKNIYLMESIKLIAIGIGMNIEKNKGKMIIDIGYETTKIGVLSLNNIIEYKTIEIGSNSYNQDIINFLKTNHEILISNKMAENIKNSLKENKITVSGKNILTSLPKDIIINSEELKDSIQKSISIIVDEIKKVLESVTPEILNDIKETGIVITGGGSILEGLRESLEKKLSIPVLETNNPLTCVIDGIKDILNTDITKATKI